MSELQVTKPSVEVTFCSSVNDDVWHNLTGPNAFESWHFDAVSDDGREALVIVFYDNFVLSPRFYNTPNQADLVREVSKHRFPAVSLVYSVDGKTTLSSVNEFTFSDFHAAKEKTDIKISENSFRIEKAEYGAGYMVTVDICTLRGRRIRAELEWLSIESDLKPPATERSKAIWNAVTPRSDVSGKITLIGRTGKVRKLVPFRGTGYHDHVSSENAHYRDLGSRMWGRAHFVDSTVIFDRHGGVQNRNASGHVYLIRDGRIHEYSSACVASEHRRDRWGLSVPRHIEFTTYDGMNVLVEPKSTVRSGFTDVKMLSEITLGLRDGKVRKTMGLTEFVDPSRMRNPFFRWISDLRIGREGRSPKF